MKSLKFTLLALLLGTSQALAFPPAPEHEIYGIVRDQNGRPLDAAEGKIILESTSVEITRAPSDPLIGENMNYRLHVPMDANIRQGFYQASALKSSLPFSIRVVIGNVSYVPVQMQGSVWQIGNPGQRTRLDLTLGVDSDGDGLPDEWEQNIIDSDNTGDLLNLGDVNPDDDLDNDGLTNLQEFQLGTWAIDAADGLKLEIVRVEDGNAVLRFFSVRGRTYRIQSSMDLTTWTAASFFTSDSTESSANLVAGETTVQEVVVPTNGATTLHFRLYGE
jgi:hypothetical protein